MKKLTDKHITFLCRFIEKNFNFPSNEVPDFYEKKDEMPYIYEILQFIAVNGEDAFESLMVDYFEEKKENKERFRKFLVVNDFFQDFGYEKLCLRLDFDPEIIIKMSQMEAFGYLMFLDKDSERLNEYEVKVLKLLFMMYFNYPAVFRRYWSYFTLSLPNTLSSYTDEEKAGYMLFNEMMDDEEKMNRVKIFFEKKYGKI